MSRAFAVAGGLLFAASLIYFVYAYGWRFGSAGGFSWRAALGPAAFDTALFSAFALHHSVFARLRWKAAIERAAPPHLERAIYVWLASVLFLIVCVAWRAVPGTLWHVTGGAAWVLHAVQAGGAALSVAAARRIDVLALAGIRQAAARPTAADRPPLLQDGPYGVVRHPVYLGWVLLVWAAPELNGTRALFAAISCLYLAMAIPLEERDLRATFGEAYRDYMRKVRWRVLPGLY